MTDSYDLWACREHVWNRSFRGKTVGGHQLPNYRFSAVFFQPFYAGQTFGSGQLNPLTALQMSDLVHQVSGLPELDISDPNAVYATIMDPDLTIPYVAATLKPPSTPIARSPASTSRTIRASPPRSTMSVVRKSARRGAEGRETTAASRPASR